MLNAPVSGKTSRFKLIKLYDKITSQTLKEEIARRKLSYELVNEYLYQAFILDRKSQRKSIAFAFPNSKDHYEVAIPNPANGKNFKTSIIRNSFTLIEGEQSNHVEVFSDVWDFLTWLSMMKYKINRFDAYILNGNGGAQGVMQSIRENMPKVRSITSFLSHSQSSIECQLADLAEEMQTQFGAQNYIFNGYGSLSDYWINNPTASHDWPIKS